MCLFETIPFVLKQYYPFGRSKYIPAQTKIRQKSDNLGYIYVLHTSFDFFLNCFAFFVSSFFLFGSKKQQKIDFFFLSRIISKAAFVCCLVLVRVAREETHTIEAVSTRARSRVSALFFLLSIFLRGKETDRSLWRRIVFLQFS